MATDYKALGKRISNARKQAGITQEALGEQLNMTRKHISVIESAIKRPSLDALVDIANALDRQPRIRCRAQKFFFVLLYGLLHSSLRHHILSTLSCHYNLPLRCSAILPGRISSTHFLVGSLLPVQNLRSIHGQAIL